MSFKHIAAIGLLGALLVGCAGEGGNGLIIGQSEPDVRLFNGIDGQSSITATFRDADLNFLGRSTSASFGGTSNDTTLTNTNITATINGSPGILVTSQPTLVRINSFYTTYTGGTSASNYKAFVLEDSQSILSRRTIGLRAVHVGANTPTVDIYLSLTPTLGTVLFSNLAFGSVTSSANSPNAVDASGYLAQSISENSTYTVTITAHGSQTPIATAQVTPTEGNFYSIAIYDAATGGTAATVLTDNRTD